MEFGKSSRAVGLRGRVVELSIHHGLKTEPSVKPLNPLTPQKLNALNPKPLKLLKPRPLNTLHPTPLKLLKPNAPSALVAPRRHRDWSLGNPRAFQEEELRFPRTTWRLMET